VWMGNGWTDAVAVEVPELQGAILTMGDFCSAVQVAIYKHAPLLVFSQSFFHAARNAIAIRHRMQRGLP